MFLRLALLVFPALPCWSYDAIHRIASARLYGNVHDFAYYFLDLSVGTPPQRVSVIVDTGSSITAFPCKTCARCANHMDPNFDITSSRTAHWLPCRPGCQCSKDRKHCTYHQGYTEGSSIDGWWFEDVVRVGDLFQQNPPMRAPMGCHQEETRLFYTQKANGIMGIRQAQQGKPTLLQQLLRDRDHIDADVFTMCIAESGGRLTVGGQNTSYHQGEVKYTKMRLSGGFFNVYLSSMTIAGSAATAFGSAIIDSGTTWSYFGSRPYRAIRQGIEEHCSSKRSCGSQRGSCWEVSDLRGFPDIEMNFEDVVLTWVPRAYLYRKGSGTRWCYSFQDDGPGANSVLGASWMMHQDVIFDMPRQRVGVVPADCPEYKVRPKHEVSAELSETSRTPMIQGVRPGQAKKFNIGLLWAGLASGACLATGFIGIAAAVCKPQSLKKAESTKSGEVVGAVQTDEEEPLKQEGPSPPNFLKSV